MISHYRLMSALSSGTTSSGWLASSYVHFFFHPDAYMVLTCHHSHIILLSQLGYISHHLHCSLTPFLCIF